MRKNRQSLSDDSYYLYPPPLCPLGELFLHFREDTLRLKIIIIACERIHFVEAKKIAVQFQVGLASGECTRMDSKRFTPFLDPTLLLSISAYIRTFVFPRDSHHTHTHTQKKRGKKLTMRGKIVIFRYEIKLRGKGAESEGCFFFWRVIFPIWNGISKYVCSRCKTRIYGGRLWLDESWSSRLRYYRFSCLKNLWKPLTPSASTRTLEQPRCKNGCPNPGWQGF